MTNMTYSIDSISFNLAELPAFPILSRDGSAKLRLIPQGVSSKVARISACVLSTASEASLDAMACTDNWLRCAQVKDKNIYVSISSITKRLGITREDACKAASDNNLLRLIAQEGGYFFLQSARKVCKQVDVLSKIIDYILLNKSRLKMSHYQSASAMCPRGIQVFSDGVAVHFTKTLVKVMQVGKGDVCFGRGTFKKVRARIWFNGIKAGRKDALASMSLDKLQKYKFDYKLDFGREIEFMKKLKGKPGIVQIYDDTQVQGKSSLKKFIGMELCETGELFELIIDGSLAPMDHIRFSLDLLYGLRSMKEEGVIHRDLKPDNIFISLVEGEKRALIGDFGLAYSENDDIAEKARTCGTKQYVSPELLTIIDDMIYVQRLYGRESPEIEAVKLKFAQATNYSRDMWSFGATLYAMRTKKYLGNQILCKPSCAISDDPVAHLIFEATNPDPIERITVEQAIERFVPLLEDLLKRCKKS